MAATNKWYCSFTTMISAFLLCLQCITPYDPGLEGESGLLVVDGSLIKGNQTQVITISRTTSISKREFIPVEHCQVKIMDNNGTEFDFQESSPGKYVANIDDAFLIYDKQYKLIFSTSSGDNYESDYQVLLQNYPVDSAYAIQENHYSAVTNSETLIGYQFYVDLNTPQDASKYYRWVTDETWIRSVADDIWAEYDGMTYKIFNRRDSLKHCWVTKGVPGLYSATTVTLSANQIKKIPLYFIVKSSYKLNDIYCATIKQYALNRDAYEYWNQKEKELNESGNIYSIQPSQSKSNIYNLNNPGELVLGFFWAASSSVKHVFVDAHKLIPDEEGLSCSFISVYCESPNYNNIVAALNQAMTAYADELPEPPFYIGTKGLDYFITIDQYCIDCRALSGGDARKPDFWQ